MNINNGTRGIVAGGYAVGNLVLYAKDEGAEPSPAIVTKTWEDGTYGLYVFNLEVNTNIRAAMPVQISPTSEGDLGPILEVIVSQLHELRTRVVALEGTLSALQAAASSETVTAPDRNETDVDVDSTSGSGGRRKR